MPSGRSIEPAPRGARESSEQSASRLTRLQIQGHWFIRREVQPHFFTSS